MIEIRHFKLNWIESKASLCPKLGQPVKHSKNIPKNCLFLDQKSNVSPKSEKILSFNSKTILTFCQGKIKLSSRTKAES